MNVLSMSEAEFAAFLNNHKNARGIPPSIGGSDVGALMGLNKYLTPAEVWDRVMDRAVPLKDTGNLKRGRYLEEAAAQEFAQRFNRKVQETTTLYFGNHRTLIARCSADRIQFSVQYQNPGLLECKCPSTYNFPDVKVSGADPSYVAQVQWYMGWLQLEWGDFAFLDGDKWELYPVPFKFDPPLFAKMVAVAEDFWSKHVLTRIRPPDTALEPLVEVPKLGIEGHKVTDEALLRLLEGLRVAKTKLALDTKHVDSLKESVQQKMIELNAEVLTFGKSRITWKEETRHTLDKKQLLQDHPELAPLLEEYTKSTAGRVFNTYWGKENG